MTFLWQAEDGLSYNGKLKRPRTLTTPILMHVYVEKFGVHLITKCDL